MIPIVVICHNNIRYVKNTISQLERYKDWIHILDNKSTDEETCSFLTTFPRVFYEENEGPWVNADVHANVYKQMPNEFILTDADLEFNKQLPVDFIDQLRTLGTKTSCSRIGFALQLDDKNEMFQDIYFRGKTIWEWETQFWKHGIQNNSGYELYNANIDTTFALLRKDGNGKHIRVAGTFTARHLPWYTSNPILSDYHQYDSVLKLNRPSISTTSNLILKMIQNKYKILTKNDQQILIENDSKDPNLEFWTNIYSQQWEDETFRVFDTLLDVEKICIDIGAWIGTTCIYAARKSKHVYAIEADFSCLPYLKRNIYNNDCDQKTTILPFAIFSRPLELVSFGKNEYLAGSKIGDSTSHISSSRSGQLVPTISLAYLLKSYHIDVSQISLIKVDIEGGEECILEDLFALSGFNLYISFHFSWWKNKDLDRFAFLNAKVKDQIRSEPFCSILFRI
jgi:FkbM family methyltransferase